MGWWSATRELQQAQQECIAAQAQCIQVQTALIEMLRARIEMRDRFIDEELGPIIGLETVRLDLAKADLQIITQAWAGIITPAG